MSDTHTHIYIHKDIERKWNCKLSAVYVCVLEREGERERERERECG